MTLTHTTSPAFDLPIVLPAGETVFAVGDVHGMADHLLRMRALLRRRASEVPGPATLVMLGDYIDRGPASVRALTALAEPHAQPGLTERFLIGNHDAMLRAVLDPTVPAPVRQRNRDRWLFNGGASVLLELGLADRFPTEIDAITALLREALPAEVIGFLNALEPCAIFGRVILTHGGIHPSVRVEALEHYFAASTDDPGRDSYHWVRQDFLESRPETRSSASALAGRFVVHGHTPSVPTLMPHRLGIDTGCYQTGVLTAVEMTGARARLHHVHPEEVEVPVLRDLLRADVSGGGAGG
ncbi:metallophosphoesterase [Muricoccus radiodurans]|uniref:metallophosphoesterase n=1 Tax=Muricoccus radiodurans TaxID=2231721 RepID=UPI003CE6B67F